MTTICPKCHHLRRPDESAPDWQCPACGVAYAKVAAIESRAPLVTTSPARRIGIEGLPRPAWVKLVVIAAVLAGGWAGMQALDKGGFISLVANFGQSPPPEELKRVAASVKPGDVVMYTTTGCPYCAQLARWFESHGFAYTECNAETRSECAKAAREMGAKAVPFVVVRGKKMHGGFDSREFLALLR